MGKKRKKNIRKTVSREENIFIKKTLNDKRTEKKNSRKKKMERQRKRNRERERRRMFKTVADTLSGSFVVHLHGRSSELIKNEIKYTLNGASPKC